MNDRVQSALKVLGIGVPPVATLEREGAFFALLEDTLIYQDAGGTRRVTLRDLNRKLAGDLTAAQVEISDAEIRAVLNEKTAEARRQFMDSQN